MEDEELSLESLKDFHQIYLRYNRLIRQVAFRVVGEAFVDDMVQECFVRAWRSRGSFKNQASIKTWLCRIALNTAIDHQRKAVVRKGTKTTYDMEVYGNEQGNTLVEKMILEAISELKPSYRSAFVLVALEGFSTKEGAETLEIDEATLRSRVSRARSQLRLILKEKGVHRGE